MTDDGRLRADARACDDPGDLLALASGAPAVPLFYWEQPASGHAVLALGALRSIVADGRERFAAIARAAGELLGAIRAPGVERGDLRMVGGFAFADDAAPSDLARGFPAARFVLPALLWIRRGADARLVRCWDEREPGAADGLVAAALGGAMASYAVPALRGTAFTESERAGWRQRVDAVRARIAAGEVRKVVLARRRIMEADAAIAPAALLAPARDARPGCFSFWVRSPEGASLIGASPELLVRRRGDVIEASALAGSAPRAADPAVDRRLGAALLASPKNGREHALVVAAVRAALEPLAATLEIPARPELLRLPEVQHLATPVRARLREPRTLPEVAARLHPTPAVCGTPGATARAILAREEPDRGWYAGAVGWTDGRGDGELAVALRTALIEDRRLTLWAGAGIVEGSDADVELAETEAKMGALVAPADQKSALGASVGQAGAPSFATPDGARAEPA